MSRLDPILETRNLTVEIKGRRGLFLPRAEAVRPVDGVSLTIFKGEVYGLVGESGCGKTTLARTLLGLRRETSGEILLRGESVHGADMKSARRMRKCIQYVHQDAIGSLDPWWSIGSTLREALKVAGGNPRDPTAVNEALTSVGLDKNTADRFPHELSGGQARRAALARIVAMRPEIVILDEPTAGLDLSVQALVLNLLLSIKKTLGLTIVLISHDMNVVRLVCDRISVMYRGRIVEEGPVQRVLGTPYHPYTRALLAVTPRLVRGFRPASTAFTTDAANWADACAFYPRCDFAGLECRKIRPRHEAIDEDSQVACLRWRDISSNTLVEVRN